MKVRKYEGFSLIEILVVVALIIILATITIVAINPAKNFRDTRNAQRSADVSQILNAITQYTSEEGNAIEDFGTITNCTLGTSDIGTDTGNINLTTILVDEYIVEIPMDPSNGTEEDSGYDICVTDTGRVQIDAPGAEDGKVISVKR
ncbi:MAG: prepilin-type N-terminal cleavage/methylation domain-containing protein [Candidatus Dojkabacteria bacterium]|jgi:type IV pilus assembly protein PilA|nr:prepilin-type N-terminal cleavage/methylation domain-containing protein [Candidatus Dojkabacteria bacterium]